MQKLFAIAITLLAALHLITPTTVGADDTFAVRSGALFNNPRGTHEQSHAIIRSVNAMINNTPTGQEIRIATMSLNIDSSINALKRAHGRGVAVKIILPGENRSQAGHRNISSALGTDTSARSFVKYCSGSCNSSDGGVMHLKLFMFSQSGTTRHITVVSSSNLDTYMTTRYNDAYIDAGTSRTYTASKNYFDNMLNSEYGSIQSSVTENQRTHFFFPNDHSNIFGQVLNKTRCTNVGSGAGYKNRTIVKMTNSLWDYSRDDIARRLVELKRQGCIVRVIVQSKRVNEKIIAMLKRNDVQVRLSDTLDPKHGNHSKYLAISGNVGGDRTANLVYTGTLNLTAYSNLRCDNAMVKIATRTNFDKYSANFKMIWDKSQPY